MLLLIGYAVELSGLVSQDSLLGNRSLENENIYITLREGI